MSAAVVLFKRNLRVHDYPPFSEAVAASELVVPLFVLEDAILQGDYARRAAGVFLSSRT